MSAVRHEPQHWVNRQGRGGKDVVLGTLCGLQRFTSTPNATEHCKRCAAVRARQKASVARASETKASRIPRTPGR